MSAFKDSILRPGGPPVNIVLLGPPAGGKGTQAGYLAERYGMIHISMGDLLRARAKFLPQLAEYISQGKLVPDDVVVSVLKERLADSDCFSRGVLLDGFPRTRAQAESLQKAGVDISAVIHLEVADEVVIDRISGRRIDPLSGKIYHVKDSPPPPEIHDRVIQREDDTPETIRRRLVTYHQERDAILDFCGDRVRTIHVGDGSPDALPADVRSMLVFDEVRKAMEGDTYWGSVIRSELIAKAFECGTSSTTMVSAARFFQHSRYRLIQNGCLADAAAACGRVLLRSQVLQLAGHLQPLVEYELRTWLQQVEISSVMVGHTISQKLENGDVVDVARAWATLVFVDSHGNSMEVPNCQQLKELAMPAQPVSSVKLQPTSPKVISERLGVVPSFCWHHDSYVAAVDLDMDGRLHEAACLAHMDRWRFWAAKSNGYPPELKDRILHAQASQAFVSYLGFVGAGDNIHVRSWLPEAVKDGTLVVAFEVQGGREDRPKALLLRGCMILSLMNQDAPLVSKL